MNKWLSKLREIEARKPQIDKKVSMVSMVPCLSAGEKCEIDKKSSEALPTAQMQPSNKEFQYLNNIQTPYPQNHRNLLSEKSETSLEMQGNDDAIAKNQKHIPRLPRAKVPTKPNSNTEKINLSPLEFYYPNHLPADICQWIMQAVVNAPESDQLIWWQQLERWADKTGEDLTPDDIAWKKTAYENIKAAWHRQTSTRLDFHLAKQIFGGRVLNGQQRTIGNAA